MYLYYSIADYTPLIQLLVGGLYLSDFFIDRKSFSLPQSIKDALNKSIGQNSSDTLRYLQLTNKVWGTSSSDEWNRKLCKSVISLMSLYGCIVLFYCANCHIVNSHIVYSMSYAGPILSTVITIGYLVWALFLYGHRSQKWHQWVVRIVFFLQISVFLYFFCINPNVTLGSENDVLIRSVVNFSILVTMTLWFGHLIKKWFLEKILVPYWAEVVEFTEYFFPNIRPTEEESIKTAVNLLKILNSEVGMGLKRRTRKLLKDAYMKKIKNPRGLIIPTNMCKGAKIIRRIAMYGGFDDIIILKAEQKK